MPIKAEMLSLEEDPLAVQGTVTSPAIESTGASITKLKPTGANDTKLFLVIDVELK